MTRYRTEPSPNRGFMWLAGVAVLVLLFWAIQRSGLFSPAPVPAERAETPLTPIEVPVAVTSYLRFAENRSAADASASHSYSADGFRHLAGALEMVAGQIDVVAGQTNRVQAFFEQTAQVIGDMSRPG